jgi:hypothetical protein
LNALREWIYRIKINKNHLLWIKNKPLNQVFFAYMYYLENGNATVKTAPGFMSIQASSARLSRRHVKAPRSAENKAEVEKR